MTKQYKPSSRNSLKTCLVCAVPLLLASAAALADSRRQALDAFETLHIKLPGSVEIIQQQGHYVELHANEETLERIEVIQHGNTLTLSLDDSGSFWNWGSWSPGKITIAVGMAEPREIHLSGSGDVSARELQVASLQVVSRGSGSVKLHNVGAETTSLRVTGSGDIEVARLNTAAIDATITGSGNMELAGSADDTLLTITGSGDFDAGDLESEAVNVEIRGSGDASVWANAELSVNIYGSGDVVYRGDARVSESIAGSGRVRAK